MGTKIIYLSYPVRYKPYSHFYFSLELKKIELRRPRIKDIVDLQFNGSTADCSNMIKLISRISGVSESIIKEIDVHDMGVISEVITKMNSERKI
jgi:hypothetical protein